MTLKLLYQTHSPFARKSLVFAHEAMLAEQIDVVHQETSPTLRNEDVFALNPLGKVPILITNEGKTIFDSSSICEYLDEYQSGEKLIPSNFNDRMEAFQMQAIADGMSAAGILVRWESARRPQELRYPPFLNGQLEKIASSYDYIEKNLYLDGKINIGHIALATSISWLEFRDVFSFQDSHVRLSAWYRAFAQRNSMIATTLSGDTQD